MNCPAPKHRNMVLGTKLSQLNTSERRDWSDFPQTRREAALAGLDTNERSRHAITQAGL